MSLCDIGLSGEADAVYHMLLAEPNMGERELRHTADCDAVTLAAVFEQLLSLGMVERSALRPSGVDILDPMTTLPRLITEFEVGLRQRRRAAGELRDTLPNFAERYAAARVLGPHSPHTETITGLHAVREKIDELAFFARRSVLAVQPGALPSQQAQQAAARADRRSAARRLHMCTIFERQLVDDPASSAAFKTMIEQGVSIRLSDAALLRMIIFDETVAVVPLDRADAQKGALVLRQATLVAGFLELFDTFWNRAEAIRLEDERGPDVPVARSKDRQILLMLASGATDEVAARELGYSTRHLRRQIARMMHELGATSRFEAGVEAMRRGWITAGDLPGDSNA